MKNFKPMREIPPTPNYKKSDTLVLFGELFSRGYANGIVDEAEKVGMRVIRSTVGRRDDSDQLKPLTEDEIKLQPAPIINVPLEAGFDMFPSADGTRPVDQLQNIKMGDWDKIKLDWEKIAQSRKAAETDFKKRVAQYVQQLEKMIPDGNNVILVHTMAGGVPRAKIMMPTMNLVFKGTSDRHVSSEHFWQSDLGRLASMNFDEVTANTFSHLLTATEGLRSRLEKTGGSIRYLAYGYHGTEVMINGRYQWQSYSPYVQGWAKMRLEDFAREAFQKGISCSVFNCPEILTNSSSIFLGVEVSLYPLMAAIQKEAGHTALGDTVIKQCTELLKSEHTITEIIDYTNKYLSSSLISSYCQYDLWPQHNGKEQMEYMLASSGLLVDMHKDTKKLITAVLSEEVFKACGKLMFRESYKIHEPVWWLGHDILAKTMAI